MASSTNEGSRYTSRTSADLQEVGGSGIPQDGVQVARSTCGEVEPAADAGNTLVPTSSVVGGLTCLSAPGIVVVAVEAADQVAPAIELLLKLRECPLDLGVIALRDGLSLPHDMIVQLAERSVTISHLHGETASIIAEKEINDIVSATEAGHENFRLYAEAALAEMMRL